MTGTKLFVDRPTFLALVEAVPKHAEYMTLRDTKSNITFYCIGYGDSFISLRNLITEENIPAQICENISQNNTQCLQYRTCLMTMDGENYSYCPLVDAFVISFESFGSEVTIKI